QPSSPAAAGEPGESGSASGPAPDADEPSPGQADTPPADAPDSAETSAPAQQDAQAAPEAHPPTPPPDDASAKPDPAGPAFAAPPAATAGRPTHQRQRTLVAAAIAALVLLLALQIVLADRERLAADALWRPLVVAACGLLGCEVPPWREPSAIVLVSRDVRPHPDTGNALRVRASFRNDARWPQAWPRLLLTLSDVDGRAVAARAFEPGEYLGSTPGAPMAPGQSTDIELDIHEPSAATVSYAFDFRE